MVPRLLNLTTILPIGFFRIIFGDLLINGFDGSNEEIKIVEESSRPRENSWIFDKKNDPL